MPVAHGGALASSAVVGRTRVPGSPRTRTLGTGRPLVRSLRTASPSADPQSRWYADQTRLFSHKEWEPEYFCSGALRAHAISVRTLTSKKGQP